MTKKTERLLITPIDGSDDALKSLDYIDLCFRSVHGLKIVLFYVLPTLPPILIDECKKSRSAMLKLKALEEKNVAMAEGILANAKDRLVENGFEPPLIETVYRKKKSDTARDICAWAENRQADALLINTRGRSRLEAFFMGETARKVLEFSRVCPVWMLKGAVKSKRVLVAVDSSVNAVRAADHAGFMLAGSDCEVTLFHTKRSLRRFIPQILLKEAAELETLWEDAAGQDIAPYLKEAREKLIEAGLNEHQIETKIVSGGRNPAADILDEARKGDYGTIVMGRKGRASLQEFILGDVTRKVVEDFNNMALWIVK